MSGRPRIWLYKSLWLLISDQQSYFPWVYHASFSFLVLPSDRALGYVTFLCSVPILQCENVSSLLINKLIGNIYCFRILWLTIIFPRILKSGMRQKNWKEKNRGCGLEIMHDCWREREGGELLSPGSLYSVVFSWSVSRIVWQK